VNVPERSFVAKRTWCAWVKCLSRVKEGDEEKNEIKQKTCTKTKQKPNPSNNLIA
jgi:hypothetical protein